jgi:hypothetical protein
MNSVSRKLKLITMGVCGWFTTSTFVALCLFLVVEGATPPRPVIPPQFESDITLDYSFGDFSQSFYHGRDYSDSVNSRGTLLVNQNHHAPKENMLMDTVSSKSSSLVPT